MFELSLSKGAALEVLCLINARIELAEQELKEARESGDDWTVFCAQDLVNHLAEARAALEPVAEDYALFCED